MPFEIKPLTLFKIIALVLVGLCFIMMFLPWITMSAKVSAFGYSESMRESENLFTVSGAGCFWTVMLQIFEIVFFLAMVLAVFGILTDRNLLVLPIAALAALMFLLAVFTCFWAKGKMNGQLGELGVYLSDYMTYKVHVGVGAWLFLLFGLGAFGVLFYEDRTLGRNTLDASQLNLGAVSMPKVNLGGKGGWTCPGCGARNGAGQNFCTGCGTKKPEPARCPNCGAFAKPGELFCTTCGTRLG